MALEFPLERLALLVLPVEPAERELELELDRELELELDRERELELELDRLLELEEEREEEPELRRGGDEDALVAMYWTFLGPG